VKVGFVTSQILTRLPASVGPTSVAHPR
jgi:hypothetical protein